MLINCVQQSPKHLRERRVLASLSLSLAAKGRYFAARPDFLRMEAVEGAGANPGLKNFSGVPCSRACELVGVLSAHTMEAERSDSHALVGVQ